MRRSSTSSVISTVTLKKDSIANLKERGIKSAILNKSITQKVGILKKKKTLITHQLSDSLSSKSEHEWMDEQEKREVRKHNAMKKNR